MTPLASRFLVATALVAGSAATALAQPSATPVVAPDAAPPPAAAPPAAPPAPQNADWSEVSHINGQLVPVGEKNEYFYQYKRTIISADPIGWIWGMYGISASYGLDDHLAIRGELDVFSPPNSNHNDGFVEGDIGLPIYFRRTYQGAFLEPGLVVRQSKVTSYDGSYDYNTGSYNQSSTTSTDTQFGPQVMVGWHWTWDSGLNIAAAVGVGRNLNAREGYSSETYIPNGYLRFGYAF